ADVLGVPIGFRHLVPIRLKPVKVLYLCSINLPALEEVTSPKDRLCLTQAYYLADKVEEGAVVRREMRLDPRHRGVLRIGIVVAVLRLSEFITRQKHRYALRKKKRGQKIALLLRTQRADACLGRRALNPAVPTLVIVSPVAIFFAVCFVVLLTI